MGAKQTSPMRVHQFAAITLAFRLQLDGGLDRLRNLHALVVAAQTLAGLGIC